jgi:hypothetical protein
MEWRVIKAVGEGQETARNGVRALPLTLMPFGNSWRKDCDGDGSLR